MKKTLILSLLLAIVSIMTTGCSSCQSANTKQETSVTSVNLDAGHVTGTDLEYMFANYGSDYRWFGQYMLLENYLDCDCDGTLVSVCNVFQVVEAADKDYDTFAVLCSHDTSGESTTDIKHGFRVKAHAMNNDVIAITFDKALKRVMESNFKKPHSRQCVLQKQIGPNICNPQYIFGNTKAQLYVDAITGAVSDKNPVFDGYLTCPLGEWP